MSVIALFRRVALLLVVVGVGASPLGAQASGNGANSLGMLSMETVADAMPCCPNEAPAAPDCLKTCPLMAVCMTAGIPAAPAVSIVDARMIVALSAPAPLDDRKRLGPAAGPPARPPRI